MLNPGVPDLSGFNLLSLHPAVAFMGVKGYKLFHGAAPFLLAFRHYKTGGGVALSYFHSGESRNPVAVLLNNFVFLDASFRWHDEL
jgi:hypothetical protein